MPDKKISQLTNLASPTNDDVISIVDQADLTKTYKATVGSLPVSTATSTAIGVVQADVDAHEARTDNPHSVTKAQVGLSNVDNTSDANKPVSTATQTALNAKQDTLVSGTNIKTINGSSVLGSGDLVIASGGGQVDSVVAGTNISVDNTDPENPVVSATGLVPYTGATGDVSLNGNDLNDINTLKFDTTPIAPANSEGVVVWNPTDKTLDIYDGITKLQTGQEIHVVAYNNTGSTIGDGKAVYISGSNGTRPTIALALADASATSDAILGITTQSIANGAEGKVTVYGLVNNIDTSAWSAGQALYLSPSVAGGFTLTEPSAPDYVVHMGHVVVSDVSVGSILSDPYVVTQTANSVKIEAGVGVEEMNNVQDFFRHSWSTGITDGGVPSSDGAGGLNITSGEAIIRDANADDADMKAYVLPSATSLALTNNDVNYVYYTLSAGALVWNVTTDPTVFDGITKVISFIVSRNGTSLSIVNLSKINVDTGRKQRRQTFEWDGRVFNGAFGSILGQPTLANAGTRNVTCTSSKTFVMNNPISSGAFNTTVAGASTFNNYSRFTNRSSWVRTDGQKQIDNTQYDNAGTLTTMTNNRWRRDDWYLILCTTLPVLCKVMGNAEGTSEAAAIAFGPPASLPPWFDGQGIVMYLGYSTIQKNASTATFYNYRGQASATSSGVTSHSALTPSSLSWTTSAHTGSNNTIAGFNSSGAAAEYTLSGTGTVLPTTSGASYSGYLNLAKGADIASATTTDIGAATGNYLDVTGTTTITGLGTVQAGTQRIVRFTGALTLTHNATSLILPGGANITTAAGDVAHFVSLGSGNWRCVAYTKADGTPLVSAAGGFGEAVLQDYTGVSSIGILGEYQATRAGTLAEVTLTCESIPVGSNLIAVLYKNSTSTGNVLNATLQVATSDTLTNGKKVVSVTSFTDATIADGDYFTLVLSSVGSTTAALNVKGILRYT